MSKQQKQWSAEFKAEVVLAVLHRDVTAAEIARQRRRAPATLRPPRDAGLHVEAPVSRGGHTEFRGSAGRVGREKVRCVLGELGLKPAPERKRRAPAPGVNRPFKHAWLFQHEYAP